MESELDYPELLPRTEGFRNQRSEKSRDYGFVATGPSHQDESYHGPSEYAETLFVSLLLALGLLGIVLIISCLFTVSVRRRRRSSRLESKLLPRGQRIDWK